MRKNKLFFISSILIIICFFTIAATCNLCGVPVEIGETTEEETEGRNETVQQTASTSQSTQLSTEASEDNHPPVIADIEMAGYSIELLEEGGAFDELTISYSEDTEDTPVSIIATDEDGDELIYSAYDSRGTNFDVTKIDNNNAEFLWVLPSEAGSYILTIEVSDDKGETVSRPIEMNLNLGVVEFIEPETEPAGEAAGESLRSFVADASISGQVNENGVVFIAEDTVGAPGVFVGDTAIDLRAYGFLSFDVSEIVGKNVLNAWLNLIANRIGDPNTFMSSLAIGSTDYGSTLDPEDFGVTTDGLYGGRPGFSDFSFTNDYLKEAVQNVITEGRQYFQLKLSVPSPSRNGVSDGFSFLLSNVSLEISYN
jgi:hypothetical protein